MVWVSGVLRAANEIKNSSARRGFMPFPFGALEFRAGQVGGGHGEEPPRARARGTIVSALLVLYLALAIGTVLHAVIPALVEVLWP
jgi:hypothetical protein